MTRDPHVLQSVDVPPGNDVPWGVNQMRLSPRQWLVTLAIVAVCSLAIPRIWKYWEPLDAGPNYRIPYSLGEDYWLYHRRLEQLPDRRQVAVLGDSVVWGHYVSSDQTLSAHLNRLTSDQRFFNAGLDGVHPAALLGLVEYYGQALSGRTVLLHCNLLWMSSKRHDLQDKRSQVNHPALVPQFRPHLPGYREPSGSRLGTVIGHHLPLLTWTRHLQIAYLHHQDLPGWTLEHPYANPLSAITLELPSPDESPTPAPVAQSWTASGLEPFDAPWVSLETSLQWQCFQQTVATLRRRGCQVLVVVGPFNEHMLTARSRRRHEELLGQAKVWLSGQGIAHRIATVLPSEQYADASHPLAEGYAHLARQIAEDPALAVP